MVLRALLGLRTSTCRRGGGDRLVRGARRSATSTTSCRGATWAARASSSGPDLKIGMPIPIDNPHEVGADRIVNAVAAYERCGGACIVVDFGTATTFDAISAEGEYPAGSSHPASRSRSRRSRARGEAPPCGCAEPRGDRQDDADRDPVRDRLRILRTRSTLSSARIREELGDEITAIATGGFAHVDRPVL